MWHPTSVASTSSTVVKNEMIYFPLVFLDMTGQNISLSRETHKLDAIQESILTTMTQSY